jgi:small G protein signaling modulator 3
MGALSRQSSQLPLLPNEDANSFTSFPDPSSSVISGSRASPNEPLQDLLAGPQPSMFDEGNDMDASRPQALSAAPSEILRNVIEYHGAEELVRRLSSMLAERDAHIAALTRLAEEYRVPKDRITNTGIRVKQAERRRLSLAAASAEALMTSNGAASDTTSVRRRTAAKHCFFCDIDISIRIPVSRPGT